MTPLQQDIRLDSNFENISLAIAAGVIWFDRSGRILFHNRTAREIFGYSQEQFSELNIADLFARTVSDDFISTLEMLTTFVDGSNSHRIDDLPGYRQDGSFIHLDLLVCNFQQSDSSRFMAIIHDRSDHKKVEWKLGLAFKVFENMNEAVLVTDADNSCIMVNQAFSAITGYTLEELKGKNPRMMSSGRHDAAFYQEMWKSLFSTGYWQGEIWNRRKNGEIYPQWLSIVVVRDERDKTRNFIAIFSDISERKNVDERLYFMAHYDPLTGLPNRSLLHDRLLQAITYAKRQGTRVAVMFLDLDRFKTINDTLGHSMGDLLLQAVAERLKGCLRTSDTVARLGGDEFILVLPDLRDSDHAGKIAQKILDLLGRPYSIRDMELHTSASIGISVYPEDGISNEELISNSDVAMYRAKDNGKNNFQFYAPIMNKSSYKRLTLENSLRRALEREEFILHYQPQIDLLTGKICGVEALIRWNNTEQGLIPPDTFIPLAEENGMIVPIGEWVLREACRQNSSWQKQGLTSFTVAVNLSAMQFHQKKLAITVEKVLQETALSPDWLELEITETGIMKHSDAISTMKSLKELGLRLAIDDFGTGYSSLSHLKRFPLDKLKVDQSFVRELTSSRDDAAITVAIINMAKSLNLKVIAEGVETAEHRDFLLANGCPLMQGYFFSKPLPAQELEQFVKGWRG